ncbi:MAG: hypothetical protein ACYTGZ_13790 [Planctomycetota bacterium]|jgi:hypothetical protein
MILSVGCGGSGGPDGPGGTLDALPLVVAAGSVAVEPATVDRVSPGIDLGRIGVDNIEAVYELTTPAGREFVFDLLSRSEGNSGAVRVSVCHASDAGGTPDGGAGSLADVGIRINATGAGRRESWFDSNGDGFARCTLRGAIDTEQVIACEVDDGERKGTVLVRIGIGPESDINLDDGFSGNYPGVLEEETLYSSDSWQFGLPTIAVSGDRTSVVVYEGDRADPNTPTRFELRMQYDNNTKAVTGGGSYEASADRGNWRDHEIAALYNVLARVRSGTENVTLRLSFDRGATFSQSEVLGGAFTPWTSRLATIAMAADYTLCVLFWQATANGGTDLVLVEGRPSAFDGTGSPTQYAFDARRVLHHVATDVTPIILGAVYSDGGDLVVGYGYSSMVRNEFRGFDTTTSFRCAVRLFETGVFEDTLVDEDRIIGKDPSVAVVGDGADMRVYYAYEGREGVILRSSDDAGRSWSGPIPIGGRSAHLPTVIARGATVDVLYLVYTERGLELALRHWDDFDAGASQTYQLTEAKREGTDGDPASLPGDALFAPEPNHKVTEISWFGYDAVRDGDDIVIVFDEHTYNGYVWMDIGPGIPGPFLPADGSAEGNFVPVEPPPLAPGMTEPLPAPDPDQAHQLKLMRIR